jgi:hypothetical protein
MVSEKSVGEPELSICERSPGDADGEEEKALSHIP